MLLDGWRMVLYRPTRPHPDALPKGFGRRRILWRRISLARQMGSDTLVPDTAIRESPGATAGLPSSAPFAMLTTVASQGTSTPARRRSDIESGNAHERMFVL